MKKIIFGLIFILLTSIGYCADYTTLNYNLIVPEIGSRDWSTKISQDIVSIDSIINMVSNDINLVTDDIVATVGGIVGRMKLVSDDGSACYILLYSGA